MDFTGPSLVSARRKTPETEVVGGIRFNLLTEREVVQHVVSESQAGRGGSIVTPNMDICLQARRDPAVLSLIESAPLIVPDGMPLLWTAKVRGTPFPERVTGSSLIFTLTEAAAAAGLSVYFLGGAPGVPEAAAASLSSRHQGLKVVGTDAPAVGFDKSADAMDAVRLRVYDAVPNIVYVGLGFPKQERLIATLAPTLPATWFVGCGAAISFAAGTVPRAPLWMQRSGLEWAHRLLLEPHRLFRRYLIDDLPFAAGLLVTAALHRARSRRPDGARVPLNREG
jgi:N-acetylglucosaminyldiphosphoundecaprenol N-acetyl-beta-D-mannosaminyltransferase